VIRKNPVRALAVFGGIMVVVSILFEYVRMAPTYRLIVEPWSIRGYDLTQGKVVAALGVAAIVLSILAAAPRGSTVFNVIVAFATWLAAVLIAQFPDPPPVDISVPAFIGITVSVIIAYMIAATVVTLLGERLHKRARRYWLLATTIAVFLLAYLTVVEPELVSPSRAEVDLSIIVAVVFGILLFSAVVAPPRELAVARIAINSALVSWIVIATLSGGTRARLVQAQIEEMGVSGTYRDTQITSGLMIAFAGMIIVFLASVGTWARKRDRLQILARARRQQEAAAQSAAELEQVTASYLPSDSS
jgi:hypothetical protein